MRIDKHLIIGAVVFASVPGIVGSIVPDIWMSPIWAVDIWRQRRGLPYIERGKDDYLLDAHRCLHSAVWVAGALVLSWYYGYVQFGQAWCLHVILDLLTHPDRKIQIFYPFSSRGYSL